MVGDDNVDRELADAFREQRETTDRWGNRLEALVEGIRKDAQAHYQEDAAMFSTMRASMSSAHKRIDDHLGDHKEERAGRVQLWIGVVLSFASAVLAAIFAVFSGRKT